MLSVQLLLAVACLLGSSSSAQAFGLRVRQGDDEDDGDNSGPGGGSSDEFEDADEEKEDKKGPKGQVAPSPQFPPGPPGPPGLPGPPGPPGRGPPVTRPGFPSFTFTGIAQPTETPPTTTTTTTLVVSASLTTETTSTSSIPSPVGFITLTPSAALPVTPRPETTYVENKVPTSPFVSSASSALPTTSSSSYDTMQGINSGNIGSNRTLVITLSTVLSVVGSLLIFGAILICCRFRRRGRVPFFSRGISPIDDEEIESWKVNMGRPAEKAPAEASKHTSGGAVRKPPSVIVYQNHNQYQPRPSGEQSPRSMHYKDSVEIPQTPVLARAPNSRPGLTDETVEGDQAFLPSPKRHPSRLSKLPSARHHRTRSSRSSMSGVSFRDQWYGQYTDGELSPRTSNDYYYNYPSTSHSERKHKRVYSSSENPPRLSLDDEFYLGGLSPRPLVRQTDNGARQTDIGVAIG